MTHPKTNLEADKLWRVWDSSPYMAPVGAPCESDLGVDSPSWLLVRSLLATVNEAPTPYAHACSDCPSGIKLALRARGALLECPPISFAFIYLEGRFL